MASDQSKSTVQLRQGTVQRRSAVRKSNLAEYRKSTVKKREAQSHLSFSSDSEKNLDYSESADTGDFQQFTESVFEDVSGFEPSMDSSKLPQTETGDKSLQVKTRVKDKPSKMPPPVLPKPTKSSKESIRSDCDGSSTYNPDTPKKYAETSQLTDTPVLATAKFQKPAIWIDRARENKLSDGKQTVDLSQSRSKTLPLNFLEKDKKPVISPKPHRKSDEFEKKKDERSAKLESPVFNDKSDAFPEIHAKLKSALSCSTPTLGGDRCHSPIQMANQSLGATDSGRSSYRSIYSQCSVQSNRDSGIGTSVSDAQYRLSGLDIEEEQEEELIQDKEQEAGLYLNLEEAGSVLIRCQSLEDLPRDQQLAVSMTEADLKRALSGEGCVTVLSDQEIDLNTTNYLNSDPDQSDGIQSEGRRGMKSDRKMNLSEKCFYHNLTNTDDQTKLKSDTSALKSLGTTSHSKQQQINWQKATSPITDLQRENSGLSDTSKTSESEGEENKMFMQTHVKTGLFRVFEADSLKLSSKKSHTNDRDVETINTSVKIPADDSSTFYSDTKPSPGSIKHSPRGSAKQPEVSDSIMAPISGSGDTESEDPETLEESYDDVYENVWIPPGKRTMKKLTSKDKISLNSSLSSTSSLPSFQSELSCDPDLDPSTDPELKDDTSLDDDPGDEYWSDDFESDEIGSEPEEEDELRSDDKLFNIVRELMKTEESYVKKIGILYKAKMQAQEFLKSENLKPMFPYIENIYQLHQEILEKFKLRIKTWETNRRIGDLMTVLGPYLKMYTDYVKNFENATNFIDTWKERSRDFAKMLRDVTKENQQGKLDIKTYMLEPVQRVPRYQLLLEQYLKHLPADEKEEKEEVEAALKAVTDAANHFQFAIKQKDQMSELIELQSLIDMPVLSSTRELRKKGAIRRMGVRSGKLYPVHVFLFNDLLLICKEWTVRRIAGYMGYTTQHSLSTAGMKVLDGENQEHPHMAIVKTTSYVPHFVFDSEEEKFEWLRAFWAVIAEQKEAKKASDTIQCTEQSSDVTEEKLKLLGKEAPVWVQDCDVSMCMLCAADFTLTRRKHHCRACGCIVCSKCSSRTLHLEYDKSGRRQRVCDECFPIITDNRRVISNKRYISRERQRKCCLCSGEMKKSENGGKSWEKFWVEVHEGGMVYCFRAKLDICAFSSQNLGGCTLELVNFKNQIVFQLDCGNEDVQLYKVHEKEQMLGWLDAFEAAMKDKEAMHFHVDPHQRRFIEQTTSSLKKPTTVASNNSSFKSESSSNRSSMNSETGVKAFAGDVTQKESVSLDSIDATISEPIEHMDSLYANTAELYSNQSEASSKLTAIISEFERKVKSKSVSNDKPDATESKSVFFTDTGNQTEISETVFDSNPKPNLTSTRTIAVQVIESELKPTKKRIQTIIARLNLENSSGDSTVSNTDSKHGKDDIRGEGKGSVLSAIGAKASMYNKESFHRGCQTVDPSVLINMNNELKESSEC